MIAFGYQARKRLATALAQNLITKEQFTEWDVAREKKHQNSGPTKELYRAKEEALRTQLFAIVNGDTPAAAAARSVRIEEGVDTNLSVGQDSNDRIFPLGMNEKPNPLGVNEKVTAVAPPPIFGLPVSKLQNFKTSKLQNFKALAARLQDIKASKP